MITNLMSRAERFFFMADEPPTSGDSSSEPAVAGDLPGGQTNADHAAQRLLKKAQDDLAAAHQELQRIKEAEMSEVDRLKKHAAEMETRALASELETLRNKVALEEHVPAEALEYLAGADEEALRGSARRLVTLIGSKTTAVGTRTQPGAGQAPTLEEQISAAEKSGNRVLSISLKNQKMRGSQI